MGVIVDLIFVGLMDVIVRNVVAGVLMDMRHLPMTMFVRMAVGVFVVALHVELLSFGVGVW